MVTVHYKDDTESMSQVMLEVDFTNEMVFSFEGPNLCMLGKPEDFQALGRIILELTDTNANKEVDITQQKFIKISGAKCKVMFSSQKNANQWGVIEGDDLIIFELDYRIWERIFLFAALLSWGMSTYYLNNNEDGLNDLDLVQDCNIIWSSEF